MLAVLLVVVVGDFVFAITEVNYFQVAADRFECWYIFISSVRVCMCMCTILRKYVYACACVCAGCPQNH